MLNNILKIIFLFLFLSCADDSISGSEEDVYPINPDNLDIILGIFRTILNIQVLIHTLQILLII